ncbi:MAG: iron-containing alcohol dehydrogenase [Bacteroidales bacterium]
MVKPFSFARLPVIWFGRGRFGMLSGLVKKTGRRVLIVTGRSSFAESVFGKQLFRELTREKVGIYHVVVPGEPSPDLVDNAVREFMEERIDLVVAVGGGSVIDAGKAISAMLPLRESVKDYLEGVGTKEHPGTKVMFIAVPTTSGTGSEATKNAVISETGIRGFKKSLRHDNLVPDVALVDPELTLSCPRDITAASGMDCFTQLTEAYLSVKANEYTDALALEGLKAVRSSLERSVADGRDIEARTGMSFAALTSGICLANAGLGVVHGFASSIGGMFDIPHGIVCGTLMASANEIIVRELRRTGNNTTAINKYLRLGKLFLEEERRSDDFYIDGFIDYLQRLTSESLLPRLAEYGLKEKDIETICRSTENKNNPVKLTPENLAEIISSRL